MRALLARYKKESAAANQRDAAMYKTMFQKLAKLPDRAPKAESKPAADAAMGDADAPATSDADNKPEAANSPEAVHMNGHTEKSAPADAPAEPMAVDS